MQWIRQKMDYLNRKIKFQTFEQFQTFEDNFQKMKQTELPKYHRLLYRLKSIDAEFEVKSKNIRHSYHSSSIIDPTIERIIATRHTFIKSSLEQIRSYSGSNRNRSSAL